MRTLALEEKLPGEVFEEYDANSMIVKINFWRRGLEALTEEVLKPESIKIKKDMTMEELLARLATEYLTLFEQKVTPRDLIVLKRNPLLNTSHLEVLSDHKDKLISQLRINEGINLFVENRSEPHPQGLSVGASEQEGLINVTGSADTPKWEIEHELDGLRFQIKFNTPSDAENASSVPD